MTNSTWGARALRIIVREIRAGQAAGEDVAAIRARVDAAYPFGQREYHPYKQWLKVRREQFAINGLMTDAEKKRAGKVTEEHRRAIESSPLMLAMRDEEAARRDGLIG